MEPTTQSTETATPRWQRSFAAFGLALVTVFVAAPVALLVLLVWVVILGAAGAQILETAHVLRSRTFAPAVDVSALIVGVAIVASLGIRIPRIRKRKPTPSYAQSPVSAGRWLLRHPWTSAGLFLFAVDVVLVPLDRSRALDVPDVLVGTILIGTALWLSVTLAYGLIRGWALVLKLVWTGVRRSSFFAGIVVLGSFLVTGGAMLLWGGATASSSRIAAPQQTSRLRGCGSSGVECVRVALKEVAVGSTAEAPATVSPPSLPAQPVPPIVVPPTVPEQPTSFERCIDELYRDVPGVGSARQAGMRMALRMSVNAVDAEDLVHSMMISVCLGAERIADVRPYFLRSVQNAVKRQKRSSRKWCPLDPDAPPAAPELCLTESLWRQVVQEQMEQAVYQSLCELDAEDRRLIEMRLWDDLSHAAIALRLGITEAAVRKRFSRAQGKLKERFERRCR